ERDAHLRTRPARADRRPRGVHDGVRALRGGARPPHHQGRGGAGAVGPRTSLVRLTKKSITTSHTVVACDVCGRRLLRGERSETFIAGGSRRVVCELCTARAAHEGWLREGLDDIGVRRNGGGRSRSLLGRL